METTTAIVDTTQRPDSSPCNKQEREIDDALLRYWPSFYRTAFRYLGNAADAEDAVQDALLLAYKRLSQFRRGGTDLNLGDGESHSQHRKGYLLLRLLCLCQEDSRWQVACAYF
jgi:Sigma-70 region 2